MRRLITTLLCLGLLAGCATPPANRMDGDAYRIRDEDAVQIRMIDAVNALREAAGAPAVTYNRALNAAAATHARDMSVQNRPWHFGSDGSSPLDRVRRTGYGGALVGEAISETFETEIETLRAWMDESGPRDVILDPRAREMGFEWFQEPNGKIWWTLVLGAPQATPSDLAF